MSMNIHAHPGAFRSILTVFGFLSFLVGVLIFMGTSRNATAQDPAPPDEDSSRVQSEMPHDDAQCVEAIRLACGRIARQPANDSVLRYTCRVETVMADSTIPSSVADVYTAVNTERIQVVSAHFEHYKDSNAVFTVIPASHTIYRSDPVAAPQKDMFGNSINAEWIRDSMLLKSRVLECSVVAGSAGRHIQTIRLSLNPDVRLYLNVEDISIVIDKDLMLPISMTISLMKPEIYKSIMWTFSDIRIEPATGVFMTPLADLFDNGRGGLKPAWSGYTLVDNRCEELATITDP